MNYVLASKSPRRQELLSLVVNEFEIDAVETNEVIDESIPFTKAIEKIALGKAEAVATKHPESVIISADTIVTLGPKRYGKPKDAADAVAMLEELSGNTHEVITGVCLYYKGKVQTFSNVSKVKFYPLTAQEIKAYVDSKEPLDKAGAYGIQGLGSLLIEEISGDFYSIMGLPISQLKRELEKFVTE